VSLLPDRSQAGDGTGELMATRRRDLTADELAAGLARTLPMGHDPDLPAQLADQARREEAIGGPAPGEADPVHGRVDS
jgi:hypothetical protein